MAGPFSRSSRSQQRLGALWAGGFGTFIVVLAVSAAVVPEPWSTAIRLVFAPTCHQMAERSYALLGGVMAVCQRCTGIYGGMALGGVLFTLLARWDTRLWTRTRLVLAVSVVPMALDWSLGYFNLWAGLPWLRTLTGIPFGLVASYFFARAVTELFVPRTPPLPSTP